jgi:hypothetical protein
MGVRFAFLSHCGNPSSAATVALMGLLISAPFEKEI